LKYLLWAAKAGRTGGDRSCPACAGAATLLRRKFFVVGLAECDSCGLRFRIPKDEASVTNYYQSSYSADYPAHRPPSPDHLSSLIRTGFAHDPEKNFARYISFLSAAGLKPGATVLDFGCSWGFGSWQLLKAGYRVYSYDVSKPRADYARSSLHCNVVDDLSQIPERLDCLFSSHVIEHLTDPTLIWRIADNCLSTNGLMIVFCPNGEPAREPLIGRRHYGYLWPQVHPMVITPRFLRGVSQAHGYAGRCFSAPYDFDAIGSGTEPPDLLGEELCLIARRLVPTETTTAPLRQL
jgi:2-polyprenyl-3-methyl-5-hydroxy-6-metoxy-1,4-benzoquinol methylase